MNNPTCDFSVSFIKETEKKCDILPMQDGSYSISLNKGSLIVKKENNLVVTISSPIRIVERDSLPNCGSNEIHIWGVKGSQFSFIASIKTEFCRRDSYTNISIPCQSVTVNFTCLRYHHQYYAKNLLLELISQSLSRALLMIY